MSTNHAQEPRIQLSNQQVIAGSVLMGVGGAIALAGMAMTGTALMSAFRQRVRQMDVPPGELARQHWSAVRNATNAGVGTWLREVPSTNGQPVAQR
jgi:hypothetical protein